MFNLEEANVKHLRQKFKDYDICIISASRDNYTRDQKFQMNKALREDLMHLPYEVITVQGGYSEDTPNGERVDVDERSFFVVNYGNYDEAKTKAFEDSMFELCAKYKQDSIFLKTKNYSPGIYDAFRKAKDFGKGPEINKTQTKVGTNLPFYTRVNGTKFTFDKKESSDKSEFRKIVEETLMENGFTLD